MMVVHGTIGESRRTRAPTRCWRHHVSRSRIPESFSMITNPFRQLPAVNQVLESPAGQVLAGLFPRDALVNAIRAVANGDGLQRIDPRCDGDTGVFPLTHWNDYIRRLWRFSAPVG